jgi:hypothetical protein
MVMGMSEARNPHKTIFVKPGANGDGLFLLEGLRSAVWQCQETLQYLWARGEAVKAIAADAAA